MIKIELLLNLSASKLARFPLRLLWMTPVTFTWLNWRGDLVCAAEGAHLLPLTVSSSSRKALKCFTPLGEKDPSIDDVLWASSAISKWESRRILSIATISVERKLLWLILRREIAYSSGQYSVFVSSMKFKGYWFLCCCVCWIVSVNWTMKYDFMYNFFGRLLSDFVLGNELDEN